MNPSSPLPKLKTDLKARYPGIVGLKRKLLHFPLLFKNPKKIFSDIYRQNGWSCPESVSGGGSTLEYTQAIRQELPLLVGTLGVRSFLDLPCGDFHWMSRVQLGVQTYLGADIVEELITANNAQYSSASRRFIVLNILENPIPKVDLIFCRDCLVHLSFHHIRQALAKFKASGSTYLATTTFTRQDANIDIPTGGHHAINLQLAPFHLPQPLRLINERSTEMNGQYPDKSLGVWRLTDL